MFMAINYKLHALYITAEHFPKFTLKCFATFKAASVFYSFHLGVKINVVIGDILKL